MTDNVLVVGGYGMVGRTLCRALAKRTDRPVIVGTESTGCSTVRGDN